VADAAATVRDRQLAVGAGRRLTIRESRPEDADALTAMYAALDQDDLYRRFFQAHVPPPRTIERILSPRARGGIGLVAVVEEADGTARIVAETSYEPLPQGGADLGITVAQHWRGWLGPYLLDALFEAARERGVTNIQADVLVENRRMLALARSRGYATIDHSERPSIVRVVMGTSGRTPPWPGPHRAPRVLVEASGGRWHHETEVRAAGFEVVVCSGPAVHRACPALAGAPCPLASQADVVVDAVAPDTEEGRALLAAHDRLHAGVPVCVELSPGAAPAAGDSTPVPDGAGQRAELAADADAPVAVALLQRLAKTHVTAQ